MPEAIFLSAGVPDPKRSSHYAATADTVAISAAVSSLVYVTLGRRSLVWGGHPAITPMIWVIAEDIGVDYGRWVQLYQSNYFEDEFPEDNERFQNVTYTKDIDHDREKSLLAMREQMFSNNQFDAAVFIGGMGGILEEFDLFRHFQPSAKVLPVLSTGGATLDLADRTGQSCAELRDELDYVALFHRQLGIDYKEERFNTPDDQPRALSDRLWNGSSFT